MKHLLLIIIILLSTCGRLVPAVVDKPSDFVDPFICTQGDHGQWHPSALVPFGLVKLGPDTYPSSLTGDGDLAHSGYNFSDNEIRGFSHFRRGSSGGTTIHDRAGLLSIFPFIEPISQIAFENPVSRMNKQSERAKAGYYAVELSNNIFVQLTATTHAGFHQYSFPPDLPRRIYVYPGNWSRTSSLKIKKVGEKELAGVLIRNGTKHFFIIIFNEKFQILSIFENDQILTKKQLLNKGGMILEFKKKSSEPLLVKVGVSLTSQKAANKNMETEIPDWNFENIRQKALEHWNDRLGIIKIEGDTEYKTIFYTALYHTCFLPVTTTDIDGTYPGLDQKIHIAEGYLHLDDYAFWDSFRTKYPLYSLVFPDVYQDIARSIYDIYEQVDNWAPFPECEHVPHGYDFKAKGKNGYQPYNTCRHEHMLMVMTDAYFKGLVPVSIDSVYPHLRKESLIQMPKKYDKIGYIPARPDQIGEYSWDAWCVAQVAKAIGNQADYEYFMKRSQYWKNTWDPSIKFNRARAADGIWLDFPEDPTINREKYTYEGSKWHWRWNAIHDVNGMIELFGGQEDFLNELEYFFDNNLYTAGNQIDLHVPFLFNFAGAPWLTQKWGRKILTEPMIQKYGTHDFFEKPVFDRIYKATPDGYLEEMDDDYGCMAAWLNLSSIGLYQICPGDPVYQITAPIFKRVEIDFSGNPYFGNKLIIEAPKVSRENIYIRSIYWHDYEGKLVKKLSEPWISHADLIKGGRLYFEMGSEVVK